MDNGVSETEPLMNPFMIFRTCVGQPLVPS